MVDEEREEPVCDHSQSAVRGRDDDPHLQAVSPYVLRTERLEIGRAEVAGVR
jgi:hypothetical protein